MTAFEIAGPSLRLAARRAYEWGRLQGALGRGAVAAAVATPSLLVCSHTSWGAACLAGFALVVAAGRMRGGDLEAGTRAGALAGILPCLLPAVLQAIDPELCIMFSERGPWICGIGGAAAGVVLGLSGRGHLAGRLRFWAGAAAALAFPASLGCIPAGAAGFMGLAIGLAAGGVPALVSRKALA